MAYNAISIIKNNKFHVNLKNNNCMTELKKTLVVVIDYIYDKSVLYGQ